MTSSTPTSPPPIRSSLPRRIIILFLQAIISGLVIAIMFNEGYPLAYLFMIFFDASAISLVSGFGARIILRERRIGWQLLASLAAMFSGLFVLGIATNWKYGLGPLSFKPGRFDWGGLIQIITGTLTVTMSLFAWRKPNSIHLPVQNLQPTQPNLASIRTSDQTNQPPQVMTTKNKISTASKKTGLASSLKSTRLTNKRKPAKAHSEKSTTAKSRKKSRKTDVQVSSNEKFRCPYCLEPVLPNDPRGIVECKICHTPHHADCWAITGVCQVPHQNT